MTTFIADFIFGRRNRRRRSRPSPALRVLSRFGAAAPDVEDRDPSDGASAGIDTGPALIRRPRLAGDDPPALRR